MFPRHHTGQGGLGCTVDNDGFNLSVVYSNKGCISHSRNIHRGLTGALLMSSPSKTQVGEAATILNVLSTWAPSSGRFSVCTSLQGTLHWPELSRGPAPHLRAWKRRAGIMCGEVLMTNSKHLEPKDYVMGACCFLDPSLPHLARWWHLYPWWHSQAHT